MNPDAYQDTEEAEGEFTGNLLEESQPAPKEQISLIQIMKTKKFKSGFMSSTLKYEIVTLPQKHLVHRSFEEFEWLRLRLRSEFPSIYV